jgi:hypothetical protein
MRIGLHQVDGKWPNLALMKLSSWHKSQGDHVEWFYPMSGNYDRVYASKIFDFTSDCPYLPENTIKGGSGYGNYKIALTPEQEKAFPDYSIYPNWNAAIGFTTRGCIRHCPFCIVPLKEGKLRVVGDIHDFWSGQKRVVLLDNNLTAAPMDHFRLILNQIIENNIQPDFSQGLDIRLLNDEHAYLLSKIRIGRSGHIHFAWDNIKDEEVVRKGVALLAKHMPLRRITFYVLIGYNSTPEEDLYRVETLRGLNVGAFVMAYNKKDPYQKQFARYVNRKWIFTTSTWQQYQRGEIKETVVPSEVIECSDSPVQHHSLFPVR